MPVPLADFAYFDPCFDVDFDAAVVDAAVDGAAVDGVVVAVDYVAVVGDVAVVVVGDVDCVVVCLADVVALDSAVGLAVDMDLDQYLVARFASPHLFELFSLSPG